jgi:Domain of unknown function (DUF4349)
MTRITRAKVPVIALAAAGVGAIALLAGCSSGTSSTGAGGGFSASSAGSSSSSAGIAGKPAQASVPRAAAPASGQPAAQTARLIPAQSIIYTASLTVQAGQVAAAAQRAASIVAAAGGYTASESESSPGGRGPASSASLQLKIPVAAYPATLSKLRSELGTQTALQQQAQDVTEQVADVTSRVGSAQAAITQLRALLRRAGTVASLLSVQDEINSQEAALESLQAQQRALARATTFATVSLQLASHHRAGVRKKKEHGFIPGLAAGWRGLRAATSWVLTSIGTILPFALIIALAGGIGYAGRQRLRRRSRPTAAAE